MNWDVIFRDAVPACAGAVVYDKGRAGILGRYVVAKTMKLANGRTRCTRGYFFQRPAALRAARNLLEARATKMGLKYVPGEGSKTLAFWPVGTGWEGGAK